VRATQNDRTFFRIPRQQLYPSGLKRLLRLERYNDYKISLAALAKQKRFILPNYGSSIKFFMPVPVTWKKWKKEQMHMKFHMSRPDLDNLLKAMLDSLMSEDKQIAHYEAAKYWVNASEGWIEVSIKDDILE
jgi:Holliday junction resolvase RusA-like endonuclease